MRKKRHSIIALIAGLYEPAFDMGQFAFDTSSKEHGWTELAGTVGSSAFVVQNGVFDVPCDLQFFTQLQLLCMPSSVTSCNRLDRRLRNQSESRARGNEPLLSLSKSQKEWQTLGCSSLLFAAQHCSSASPSGIGAGSLDLTSASL